MYLKIDFESDVPIYTQLRNQIVQGIAMAHISEGDELPSVRQLAEDIGINMHTVNKAYTVLKQEGFIRLDRRKGAVVSLNFQEKEIIMSGLTEELKVILAEAVCKDISSQELIGIILNLYNIFGGE